MQRFYKHASYAAVGGCANSGFAIHLDGRPVKTPDRNALVLPHVKMAQALVDEWQAQGDEIDPRSMPFTGMANAAIDKIAPDREHFINEIAAYGQSDTFCYRAEPDQPLAARQDVVWEPFLVWAERQYDVQIVRVAGIIHHDQPERTLHVLRDAVRQSNSFTLAALSIVTGLTGSLVAALAVRDSAFDSAKIWDATCLEEYWQEENWGKDHDATEKRAFKRIEFDQAVKFCHFALAR